MAKTKDRKTGRFKEGVKFDQDKLRMDLLPPEAIEEYAKIMTFGAKKYDERNWEKGMDWGRVYGAAIRHLLSFWKKEDLDPESKELHLSHAIWNIGTLITYYKRNIGKDTRGYNKPQ